MRGLQIIPYGTKIDFIGKRKYVFALSLLIVFGSIAMVMLGEINFGIDFKGGFLIEARTPNSVNFSELRTKLSDLKLGEIKLQEFGSDRDIIIRIEQQKGGEQAQSEALNKVKNIIGNDAEYRRIETVGPKVSESLIHNAIFSLMWAMLGILIYVWFRFEWQFSICAIIAISHDAFAILGLYGITNLEFNETAIIAILTTLGYSINDTVVIYDRIRENLRKYKKMSMVDIINLSMNETLSRTILTSSSTMVALLCLYFFGGSVLASFTLPIIVGIAIGTFSSICVAAPLLLYFPIYRGDDSNLASITPDELNYRGKE